MPIDLTTELMTGEAVRAYYDAPHEVALGKEMKRLDHHCRAFLAAAPFVVIATADARGRADASPRGDAPGFVAVRDDTTLLIPDRRGNNRVDAMMNITENPHVGLLFMVPGVNETLRVNGQALITIDRVTSRTAGSPGQNTASSHRGHHRGSVLPVRQGSSPLRSLESGPAHRAAQLANARADPRG